MTKPRCQFAEDSTIVPHCTQQATRKWGDHWFCEVHGGREKPTCEISQTAEPDPVPAMIAELLAFEGLAPETRTLIELALEAQKSGAMPHLSPIKCAGCQGLGVVGNYEQTDPCPFCQEGGAQ